jgi:hypothetical protein
VGFLAGFRDLTEADTGAPSPGTELRGPDSP